MFKHILVPTDGSQLSTDTVKRAISFARDAGARISFFFAKLNSNKVYKKSAYRYQC